MRTLLMSGNPMLGMLLLTAFALGIQQSGKRHDVDGSAEFHVQ